MSGDETGALPSAMLVDFLREHHLTCPICRADLHALMFPRCPACGCEICLALATTEPYRRLWGWLLAVQFVHASVGLLFVSLVIRHMSWPAPQVMPSLILFVFGIPTALAVLLGRRHLFRMPKGTQLRLLVLGAVFLLAAVAALFAGAVT